MLEEITPYIARDSHETAGSDPAGQPPKQIVAGDEREQQDHGRPQLWLRCSPRSQDIDQVFDPVLRTDRAANRGEYRGEDQDVAARMPSGIMHQERAGPARCQTRQRCPSILVRTSILVRIGFWSVLRSHKSPIDAIGLG